MDKHSSRDDFRIEILVSFFGLLVLGYIGGAYSAKFNTFPFSHLLSDHFSALRSTEQKGVIVGGTPASARTWQPSYDSTFGVVHTVPSRYSPGYTLYASGHRSEAVLIDRDGQKRHTWALPFTEAWTDPPHLGDRVPAERIYWRRIHLFDNGDLLAIYTGEHVPVQGYGMVKIDRESKVLWSYAERTHHDFDLGPDGHIFALIHRFRDTTQHPVRGVPQLPETVLADSLVRLSPTGREHDRIPLLEALAESPFSGALQTFPGTIQPPGEKKWDVLHTCSVSVVGPHFADTHSFAEPGHLLVTFRTLDLIALLDPDRRQIVWASRGAWWQPTDADPLPDGDILVFDSNGHGAKGLASRVLKFDPSTEKVSWSFSGNENHPFWAREGGTHQQLSDGHLLVTSPLNGQIQEIAPDKTLIWEYRNRVHRTRDDGSHISILWDAQRVRPGTLEFLPDP